MIIGFSQLLDIDIIKRWWIIIEKEKCNFYTCQKNLKKQGQWSKDDKSDETVKKSVKLYPGFQESIEEKSSNQINGEISGILI